MFVAAVWTVFVPSAVLPGTCESTADLVSAAGSISGGCHVAFVVSTVFKGDDMSESAQISTAGEVEVECPSSGADGVIPTQAMAKAVLSSAALAAPNGECWHTRGSSAVSGEPGSLRALASSAAWRWHATLVTAASIPLSYVVPGAPERLPCSTAFPVLAATVVGSIVQTVLSLLSGYSAALSAGLGFGGTSGLWFFLSAAAVAALALAVNTFAALLDRMYALRYGSATTTNTKRGRCVCPAVLPAAWPVLAVRIVVGCATFTVLYHSVLVLAWGMSHEQAALLASTVSTTNATGWAWLALAVDAWHGIVRFMVPSHKSWWWAEKDPEAETDCQWCRRVCMRESTAAAAERAERDAPHED